jgi:hypothetical protein
VLVLLALALALLLLGPVTVEPESVPAPPRWDMPARMVVATALVLGLTEAAPLLGARLSGVLATYPVFATVLAVFAHRSHGVQPAQVVLRGLLLGLFSFAGFYLALGLALEQVGIAASFVVAVLAALAIQGLSLRLIRRPARR